LASLVLVVFVVSGAYSQPRKTAARTVAAAASGMWVTGYYPIWSYCSMSPSDLDWSALTHVILFTADPDPTTYPYFSPVTKPTDSSSIEWGVPNPNCSPQGKWGKPAGYSYIRWLTDSAHAHGAKVLLCLGGIYGAGRDKMATIGADSVMTQAWAEAAVAYIKRKGMDGVDLDWEYPSGGTNSGYMRMLRILRRQLNTMNPPGVLAIAAPAWTDNSAYDYGTIGTIVDQINIMSYDFSGGNSAWFNAGLGNNNVAWPNVGPTNSSSSWWNWNNHGAKQWLEKGVPANRLAMGIPFYSWKFTGPTGVTQPISGRSYGTYSEAVSKIGQYGMGIYHWDDSARAPYLTYNENGTNYYITYDDTNSVKYKAQWCKDNKLGGVMLYELVAGWVGSAPAGKRDPLLKGVKSIIGGSTIVPTPPNAPVPSSPGQGAIDVPTSTTLAWNGSTGASSYRLQVSTTTAFTTLVLDRGGIIGNSSLVTGLAEGTTYSWRVSATNTAGTSSWSTVRSFTTVPPVNPIPDVAGTLFFDANQNHLQDAGEPAMAGWTVTLAGSAAGTDITDSSGAYAFFDLPAGPYSVTAQPRPLWSQTSPVTAPSIALTITDGMPPAEATFGMYSASAFPFGVERGWNIVALPVRSVEVRKTSVFPLAITEAYAFIDGYHAAETLKVGEGYWLKFRSAHTVWTAGPTVAAETVAVFPGWNFLGSLSVPVPVTKIVPVPAGIITGSIYGYKRGTYLADSIRPGQGYWVQVSAPGILTLSSAGTESAPSKGLAAAPLEAFHSLTFTCADGSSQTLYFGSGAQVADIAMPPLPPPGVFDARFTAAAPNGSALLARVLALPPSGSAEAPIELQSALYPMEISWEMRTSEVVHSLRIGRDRTVPLVGKGSVTLDRAASGGNFSVIAQASGAQAVPDAYVLRQNYPNPFNGTTEIGFSIPSASRVRLEVFNVLGEKVSLTLDADMGPGSYTVPFDAGRLATGVYFYTLTASSASTGEHVLRTGRMVLSK
jgi:chitinase